MDTDYGGAGLVSARACVVKPLFILGFSGPDPRKALGFYVTNITFLTIYLCCL